MIGARGGASFGVDEFEMEFESEFGDDDGSDDERVGESREHTIHLVGLEEDGGRRRREGRQGERGGEERGEAGREGRRRIEEEGREEGLEEIW